MRKSLLIVVMLLPALMLPGGVAAQVSLSPFEDVPPWHWAFDAVEKLAREGIIQGYPRNDRDLALNAVVQVYEAFAHPTHPSARTWAEAFLTNLPAGASENLNSPHDTMHRPKSFTETLYRHCATVTLLS